jgi:peptide/nickel transport system substrate-binding protein
MKLMKIVSRSWLVVVLLAVLLAGLGISFTNAQSQEPVYGGTLIVSTDTEPPGLDPTTIAAAATDRITYNNIMQGLVRIDRYGNIVPAIAERWEISKDGLEYTFYLRNNVKFHNGRLLTAKDVKFTFERAMNPATGVPLPKLFEDISKVEVVDDLTVKFMLKRVNANFLFYLAQGDSVIVAEEEVEKLKSHPIGTGPFKFVEWVRGDHITLERFEDYYGTDAEGNKLPYLDKVIFKFIPDPAVAVAALEAGDIDVIGYAGIVPERVPEIAADPRFKVLEGLTTTDVILSTNNSRPPFNDKAIRRAMCHAINREELIETAMYGFGIPIGSHASPLDPFYLDMTWVCEYNPEKSKKLLAIAGYPNGFKATLKLPIPYAYAVRSGEVIKDQLAQVGIDLEIEMIEWGRWLSEVFKEANYDLTVIGHAEPFDIYIYANPNYYFRYNNPEVQELIKQGEATVDLEARKLIYWRIQWIIADDAVNGFLFNLPLLTAMKKEIEGWWKDAPIHNLDVTEVYIAK